ncbi:MAG: pilus assembly protein TadG-related protein [Acidimicrobiia bacterium]
MRVVTNARNDERGAIAVIVAICAILLFGFAAYSIDAGHTWETRRHIVTGSDAAALATASAYARGTTGCNAIAADYLDRNVDGAALLTCDAHGAGNDSGYVTVRGETTVDYTFARIFGNTDSQIRAATTAEWGLPKGISGLRPFGLCIDANQQLEDWLNLPNGPTGPSGEITITYAKSNAAACGGAHVPGNWGIMDFNGGSNPTGEIRDWILNGYQGEIGLPSDVLGQPGAFSPATNSELEFLRDSGDWFALPVFDTATGTGSGASLHVVAAVYVNLLDFQSNGPEAGRYFTLKFDRGVLEGRCCSPTATDTGVRVLRICDVDTLSPDTSDKGC